MFHFEHVNEIVSRVSFVSWIIPSPSSSDPRDGKKFPSRWVGDRSFETSISEIENFRLVVVHYDFPTS